MRLLGNSSVCDGCDMHQLDKYLEALYKPRATVQPARKPAPTASQDEDDVDVEGEEDGDPDCEPIDDDGEETAEAAAEDGDGISARHPPRSRPLPDASVYLCVAPPMPGCVRVVPRDSVRLTRRLFQVFQVPCVAAVFAVEPCSL